MGWHYPAGSASLVATSAEKYGRTGSCSKPHSTGVTPLSRLLTTICIYLRTDACIHGSCNCSSKACVTEAIHFDTMPSESMEKGAIDLIIMSPSLTSRNVIEVRPTSPKQFVAVCAQMLPSHGSEWGHAKLPSSNLHQQLTSPDTSLKKLREGRFQNSYRQSSKE